MPEQVLEQVRIMRKFNRTFNALRNRRERWFRITELLACLKEATNDYGDAKPAEVSAMREIYREADKCFAIAKGHFNEIVILS